MSQIHNCGNVDGIISDIAKFIAHDCHSLNSVVSKDFRRVDLMRCLTFFKLVSHQELTGKISLLIFGIDNDAIIMKNNDSLNDQ